MIQALSTQAKEQALAAARGAAERLDAQIAVAIVDASGNLSAFLRVGRAFLASSDLAIDKAWTAASFGMSTRDFSELLDKAPPNVREGLLRRPRVTVVPGGMPILHDGTVAGAIGISGGSEVEDEMIGKDAIAALLRSEQGE